ncbi:MAG: hypothetical protein V1929_09070 [bacterium]
MLAMNLSVAASYALACWVNDLDFRGTTSRGHHLFRQAHTGQVLILDDEGVEVDQTTAAEEAVRRCFLPGGLALREAAAAPIRQDQQDHKADV